MLFAVIQPSEVEMGHSIIVTVVGEVNFGGDGLRRLGCSDVRLFVRACHQSPSVWPIRPDENIHLTSVLAVG